MNILHYLLQSYVVVALLAIGLGLSFPFLGNAFAPYTTLFLQIIFFLSSLKIDSRHVARELKSAPSIAIAALYMLIIFPALTFGAAKLFHLDSSVALLLLAAMPAGMTSPLLAEIIGGSVSFALIITVVTSLLAPFTVPIVIKALAGSEVVVPLLSMIGSLLLVIILPFILAQLTRHFFEKQIKPFLSFTKPFSIFLLGLLITSVISQQSGALLGNPGQFVEVLAVLAVFFIATHAVGYWGIPWLNREQRLASLVCLAYMNFTLAIYLAATYFPSPSILIPVVLSVFPWALGIIPLQTMLKRRK
ncbi:bile acid:sodium symporter [Candidatus Uhrbacteria bacterium]|nr:bile acid:sodium symporter [Candidatus Uhrbacteria bacterium]